MYYSEYDFPVFTVMDEVQHFKGKLAPRLFYVETNQYFPLRGNGWYSQPMIEYCLKEGILSQDDVKYVIYASCSIPHDFFNKLIQFCYANLGEHAKLAINSMIGMFKPKVKKNYHIVTPPITDSNNCFYHYLTDNGSFIHTFDVNDTTFYQVFREYLTRDEETEKPLYNMVLDMEAVELHKLTKVIESKKGLVLDLSTDSVSCVFKGACPFGVTKKEILT
jgi:hypothetical protein